MIRELAEALAPKRVRCSQLKVIGQSGGIAIALERCEGLAVTTTPIVLGAPHPRPLCASCALGLAVVLENETAYSRVVAAAGLDVLELAAELRRGAERGLS